MRALSYNIHKGIGGRDRRYRLRRILEVIAEQDPDLICLQEVDHSAKRSRRDDQPSLLADHFGVLGRLFQLNVRRRSGGGYGNLILSRWPLRQAHQISLRMDRRKPRGAQLAVVETPQGPLHLVHAHLGLSDTERLWQVAHLLQHPLFQESAHLPTLFLGDTNDWRNRLGQALLHPAGFTQITSPPARFRTFPAYLPTIALDKAFARGAIAVRHAHVIRSRPAKDASDHLPLIIDFQLGDESHPHLPPHHIHRPHHHEG